MSNAARRKQRVARRRNAFQKLAPQRRAEMYARWETAQQERLRQGFGIDIVQSTPDDLVDVTPTRHELERLS